MQKRTLFIGDVHGCYDELMELCDRVKLTPVDHLYFVGDLINK
jgi:bis(5'-nucleosyl)-tetraphosphatase (symmetrical)